MPASFDYPKTKRTMWHERSARRLVAVANRSDLFVYGTGAAGAKQPSYVYVSGYLKATDSWGSGRRGLSVTSPRFLPNRR